jgi:hypothetical protein
MAKRKPSEEPNLRKLAPGKQYPDVRGKVVHWAEHFFEEGTLYIRVRFTDKTELCWTLRTASVIQEADLSDWKTGNYKQLKVYVSGESAWE